MALVKCPKCGRENVSDKATACPDCGFEIKKHFEEEKNNNVSDPVCNTEFPTEELPGKKSGKNKLLLLIPAAVILAVVILAVMIATAEDKSKFGPLGCLFGHTWEDATCVAPQTCSICKKTQGEAIGHTFSPATCTLPEICTVCGELNGEPTGHDWAEATCESPKTCRSCSITEGSAKGHTTKLGICSRCNEAQEELIEELEVIVDHILASDALVEKAINSCTSVAYTSRGSSLIIDAIEYIRDAYDEMNKAYGLCGIHDEFTGIKKHVKKSMEHMPTYNSGVTVKDSQARQYAIDILTELADYLEYTKDALVEVNNLLDY